MRSEPLLGLLPVLLPSLKYSLADLKSKQESASAWVCPTRDLKPWQLHWQSLNNLAANLSPREESGHYRSTIEGDSGRGLHPGGLLLGGYGVADPAISGGSG